MEDLNDDGATDLLDIKESIARGEIEGSAVESIVDGDFRSPECVELLKEADIVVTNPPFSLFREYLAQLIEHDKKFLILGNLNAITYKEVFPLLKDEKMWIGVRQSRNISFRVPEQYVSRGAKEVGGAWYQVAPAVWFTNLDNRRSKPELMPFKKYYDDPSAYPKYDNYDAINVDRLVDIPCDYDGVMGVPITCLLYTSPSPRDS